MAAYVAADVAPAAIGDCVAKVGSMHVERAQARSSTRARTHKLSWMQIETPACVIDLDSLEANIRKAVDFVKSRAPVRSQLNSHHINPGSVGRQHHDVHKCSLSRFVHIRSLINVRKSQKCKLPCQLAAQLVYAVRS
jgi:hypothetical protein